MNNLYTVYFSATDTTARCVRAICRGYGSVPKSEINLADDLDAPFPDFSKGDVVVVAAPVYGGRLPAQAADSLKRLNGNGATAIASVVFGNRDYDDALLELTDLLDGRNFRIAGAGAFIGQHSIFPEVGTARPDADDEKQLLAFGKACRQAVDRHADTYPSLPIKGKRPYKPYAGVPLHPSAKAADCARCGKCVADCPAGAIPADRPYATDPEACISCGRCIRVCSTGARRYGGAKYRIFGTIFRIGFSKRKEPEWTVAE